MKSSLTILFLIFAIYGIAQSKKDIAVLSNTRLLEQALFEGRDSSTIENLFAKSISYSQDGKNLTREEAIRNLVNDRAVYTRMIDEMPGYNVQEIDDSLVVKHFYKAVEKKEDSFQPIVRFSIEAVWAKEKRKWRLFRCRIVKLY